MISHFAFRAPAVTGGAVDPQVASTGGGVDRPAAPTGAVDPLGQLLASLRGREVTVLVGAREVTGRVVQAEPVTLVGPTGAVTVIAPGAAQLVRF